MKSLNYNYPAAWTLVGSFCGNLGKAKNPLMGAVPNQAKAFSQIIPLETTTKQHPLQGFFTSIAAALPALSVGKSQPPERTDDRNHVSAGWGRSCISQDTQDVGVKGLNHAATVSHVRAVAATDLAEPTMKLHAGTANRTVRMVRVQPNPIYDLAIS